MAHCCGVVVVVLGNERRKLTIPSFPSTGNIDVQTPYNYSYHGYWVNDPTSLNPRFGDSDDLLALSDAVHKRNMYLMVDIVVNNVPSLDNTTSQTADALVADDSFWQDPSYFHPICNIDYDNQTSVEYCWLETTNVSLMDVNTENAYVISTLESWITSLVSTYSIDGLRIDAAKHVPGTFWPGFCGAAGVFCIGEVYTSDIGFGAEFQTEGWMDSILGYPYYYGLMDAFSVAPMGNMSSYITIAQSVLNSFPHPEYLGNFLENHDLARFRNLTVDPRLGQNAMVAQFLFEGMPVAYYGQEQNMAEGSRDPYNRAALWPLGYENGTTTELILRLNTIRHKMIEQNMTWNGETYMDARSSFIAYTDYDVAIRKGPIISVLTNRGSPTQNVSFGVPSTGWARNEAVVDLLTCNEFATGSGGSISVSYSADGYGGLPYVFMLVSDARTLNICTNDEMGILSGTAEVPVGAASANFPSTAMILAATIGAASLALL